jgi:hypothetical protein
VTPQARTRRTGPARRETRPDMQEITVRRYGARVGHGFLSVVSHFGNDIRLGVGQFRMCTVAGNPGKVLLAGLPAGRVSERASSARRQYCDGVDLDQDPAQARGHGGPGG